MAASGRFLLRLPPELHARLRKEAHASDTSLNQHCVELLAGDRSPNLTMGGIASFDVSTVLAHWESELEGLVLFGSASRGDLWETSDIDLLLVVRDGIEITRDLYRKWEAASRWDERVSPQFAAVPETEEKAGGLWLEAAIDGIVLWDRGLRVSRLLGRLRRAMAEGRLLRRYAHGQPYWVRTRSVA